MQGAQSKPDDSEDAHDVSWLVSRLRYAMLLMQIFSRIANHFSAVVATAFGRFFRQPMAGLVAGEVHQAWRLSGLCVTHFGVVTQCRSCMLVQQYHYGVSGQVCTDQRCWSVITYKRGLLW